jgi:hypothetical protein
VNLFVEPAILAPEESSQRTSAPLLGSAAAPPGLVRFTVNVPGSNIITVYRSVVLESVIELDWVCSNTTSPLSVILSAVTVSEITGITEITITTAIAIEIIRFFIVFPPRFVLYHTVFKPLWLK